MYKIYIRYIYILKPNKQNPHYFLQIKLHGAMQMANSPLNNSLENFLLHNISLLSFNRVGLL